MNWRINPHTRTSLWPAAGGVQSSRRGHVLRMNVLFPSADGVFQKKDITTHKTPSAYIMMSADQKWDQNILKVATPLQPGPANDVDSCLLNLNHDHDDNISRHDAVLDVLLDLKQRIGPAVVISEIPRLCVL